jgi:hypothetical protein
VTRYGSRRSAVVALRSEPECEFLSTADTADTGRAAEFTGLMIAGSDRLQREINYNPTRFRQMVADHGGVGAAQHLLNGPDASDGFTTLWEANRLELSVEAHVLLPRFTDLFTEGEKRTARYRLEEHGMDVDAFLGRVGDGLP